jgi:hypothetical protein
VGCDGEIRKMDCPGGGVEGKEGVARWVGARIWPNRRQVSLLSFSNF